MAKNTNKPKDTRPDAVARMIDLSDDPITPSIRCPFSYKGELCEAVPHIKATVLGRNVVSKSSSGAELIIQFFCEAGHGRIRFRNRRAFSSYIHSSFIHRHEEVARFRIGGI